MTDLVELGFTGIQVPRVILGLYSVTGMYGRMPLGRALELVRTALDMGLKAFDTAAVYGAGLGEEILWLALRSRIDEAVVITKIGYIPGSQPPRQSFEKSTLLRMARESCSRLHRCPDIILAHNPPLEVVRGDQLWETLDRIVDEGLAITTGVALGPEADVLPQAMASLGRPETKVIQFIINALEVEPGATIAALAKSRGAGTMGRVPFAGGVLDETLRPGVSPGDHRSLRRPGWYTWAHTLYRRLKPLLEELPGTPAQKAIRIVLDLAPVDTVVTVAKSPSQLAEHAAAVELPPIPPSVIKEIVDAYRKSIISSPEAPVDSLRLLGLFPNEE